MAKEKTRRKGSLEALKKMVSPTKEFDFLNPEDEDDILVFTARKLSPGHMLQLNSSTLIRAYKLQQQEVKNEEGSESKTQEELEMEAFERVLTEVESCAEVASMSLIDEETEETIFTKEQCLTLFPPEWLSDVSRWALRSIRPLEEGEGADDTDTFLENTDGQEAQEIQEEQE